MTFSDENAVRELYQNLLRAWNRRSAQDFAGLFSEHASVVGFDGSMMHGPQEIEPTLREIFASHETGRYVGIVRSVRPLAQGAALLQALAGMVLPGQTDINPAVNAVQSLVAAKNGHIWRIELFQNTPAQFHGRPELSERLTEELRKQLS